MDFEKWCQGCLVRCFPWIDGKRIYFNVRYFAPGQSINKPPVWDKTVYLVNDEQGQRLAYQFTDTMKQYELTQIFPYNAFTSGRIVCYRSFENGMLESKFYPVQNKRKLVAALRKNGVQCPHYVYRAN